MENQTQPSAQNDPAVVKYDNPKDVLIAARKLIEKPECWTQGYYARFSDGELAEPNEAGAVAWCMIGACLHVENFDPIETSRSQLILHQVLDAPVTSFNDAPERTHAEVLAAFDRAIAAAVGDA